MAAPARIHGGGTPVIAFRSEEGRRSHINNHNNEKNMNIPKPSPQNPGLPFLSFAKPSWLVKSESNVRKETSKKPEPSCVVCLGSGRVDCLDCCGKGRRNHVDSEMLPAGEWPKWCKTCGGSGLGYCSRCLGTGEYRYIMGFHFMNTKDSSTDV
ncbi:DnaJ/Hsp40 cysteine-rich domain superfamily protein [Euphorbia peplus]|nr:DnaJ/Hsp40 cysteine-rich domain superfamily protein [Euphorbia peplus]